MGKIAKLHRRLVKKRHDLQWHKKALRSLLGILEIYSNPTNWRITDRDRDIMQRGVVIGVEQILEWNGPGNGPGVAERIIKEVRETATVGDNQRAKRIITEGGATK